MLQSTYIHSSTVEISVNIGHSLRCNAYFVLFAGDSILLSSFKNKGAADKGTQVLSGLKQNTDTIL